MKTYKQKYGLEGVEIIGEMSEEDVAIKLREMGAVRTAKKIEFVDVLSTEKDLRLSVDGPLSKTYGVKSVFNDISEMWPFKKPIYLYTSHEFGFIPLVNDVSQETLDITHPGAIQPDTSLKNSQINIRLDRLRVEDYPGSGKHDILFEFNTKNWIEDQNLEEDVNFAQTYSVQGGGTAPIAGHPIFQDLNVGENGIHLGCATVNVKSSRDKDILKFLDSNVFKNGLKLVTIANPAIAPLSSFAVGVTKSLAKQSENSGVQNFRMGLDFSSTATGLRLREGSYIAVQVPENMNWNWNEWVYDPKKGKIVDRIDNTTMIPYNYIVFSISR